MKVLSIISALSTIALFGAVSPGGTAHAQAPAPAQFGRVDIGKVVNESKERQAGIVELQRTQANLENVFQRLGQGSANFLAETEIAELAALYEVAKPTDAQKKRLAAIEEKSDVLKREMTTLQNTQTPDAAQTTRYTQLTALRDKGNESLNKLGRTLTTRLQEKARDADQKAIDAARASVAKIAKAKGLAVVFTGDIAVYASVDVTDEVIKDVNK
ncbi:MAG: OmpH family outer membrane protein [Armatimonadetes bacterium]|nr:OmpH family outer membrane protein [Armatimonadota bacterium]